MKSTIILGAIVLAIALMVSGCLTTTVDSKVNKDGSIERYNLQMEMGSYVYGMLNNYGDQTLKEVTEERGATYAEEWNKGNVTITMMFNSPVPESINVISEVQGDYIIYMDNITSNNMMNQAEDETTSDDDIYGDLPNLVTWHYYLEMPGEIVDSNADVVKGNKAEWHMVDSDDSRSVYAKSENPSNTIPGFSSIMGIFALFVLIFIVSRR